MRNAFANHMIKLGKDNNNIFLTGDLGFMALEGVRDSFGSRFINCGVSEQNMIGVAAGMAKSGFSVYAYSIAPFIYARPFEQIRNDIMLSDLPICLIGNGGGYAYGYMGPTHHALEDISAMNSLGLDVYVPAFDNDIAPILDNIDSPSYLRLGFEILPDECKTPTYEPWRKVHHGDNGIVIALGPMTGIVWEAVLQIPKGLRPSIWSVTDLDASKIPKKFFEDIENKSLCIYEEHIKVGGLGMTVIYEIMSKKINVHSINHNYASGYPKKYFGSQNYHREQNRLDIENIKKDLSS